MDAALHNKEKRALERAAIRLFVELYNRAHPVKLRLLYQQEKPDAVLEDARRAKLGLEITHLFYDELEAKQMLGRSGSSGHGPESFDVLLGELNERIKRKERKMLSYEHSYPISLLIRNLSPAFGISDFIRRRESLYDPQRLFQDIWLLSRDGSADWRLANIGELAQDGLQ